MHTKYFIRKNKESKFDVFIDGFVPMYCATYDSKEDAKKYIEIQKEYNN